MQGNTVGRITKITGSKVLLRISDRAAVNRIGVEGLTVNYVSIGSLVGTSLTDGRTLVMAVEEIYDSETDTGIIITAGISGIFDEVLGKFTFGTNTYPIVGEKVYKLDKQILNHIFMPKTSVGPATIGTYVYDSEVTVGYEPNVLFGKHLGVFGNTGSGKTCTVVSIIQRYIRENHDKDLKFIILDVNGEYKSAFKEDEADYIPFNSLRFHHSILSNPEYGRLFRAAEGVQYPALRDCIDQLTSLNAKWDLKLLSTQLDRWIDVHTDVGTNGRKDLFTKNNLTGHLRTMQLRIDGIISDDELMQVINSSGEDETLNMILSTDKKVIILDLQVSSDALDIVVYMLFKAIYQYKSKRDSSTHLSLVLEEEKMTPESLIEKVNELYENKEKYISAMQSHGVTDAAQTITDMLVKIAYR